MSKRQSIVAWVTAVTHGNKLCFAPRLILFPVITIGIILIYSLGDKKKNNFAMRIKYVRRSRGKRRIFVEDLLKA